MDEGLLEIYLIRHAETEVNVENHKIGGRSNWTELTKNGIAQARALGERLRSENIFFDAVYSSPAVRTQQTARYCLESMSQPIHGVQLEPLLIELSQGDWEGKLREEIYSRPHVAEGLKRDNWTYIPGDIILGESQEQTAQRMKRCLDEMIKKHREGRIAAFSHGLAIKFLLTEEFGYDKKTAYTIPIDNTSITILRHHNGKLTCSTRNDTTHLQQTGITKIKNVYE